MKLYVRKTQKSDLQTVAKKLRTQDRAELAKKGRAPLEALTDGYRASPFCYTLEIEGQAEAMFGLVPDGLLGKTACVWYLGGPGIERHKKEFYKLSRLWVHCFLGLYPLLYNETDAGYAQAVNWLRHLGAQFIDQRAAGKNAEPFLFFILTR